MSAIKLKYLIELARENGLDKSQWFVNGLRVLSVKWNDYLYDKMLKCCLNSDRRPLLETTFPVPTRAEDLEAVDAPYKIGKIANTDIDFGITPLHMNQHCIISGKSGTGKTTIVKILVSQIVKERETKILVIDPKEGGDFRFLARMSDDVVILRPYVLRLNPFTKIPNLERPFLREAISEITADSYSVYDASEGIISAHVQRVFEQYDKPTFFDFVSSLKTERARFGGRKQGYLDSLDTRVTKTLISLGNVLNCREDYFSKLFERNIVIETGELSGSMQKILVSWLVMKFLLYSIKNPGKGLSRLIVFDEGQSQIWSRDLEMRGRTPFMATLATQARSFGVGIIVLAQNPATKLLSEILGNSCVKIVLHLGSGVEVQGMAQHMGLDYNQMAEMYLLNRQEAVCRLGLGYMKPVRLNIYDFYDDPVSNEELNRLMKPQWDELLEGIEPALEPALATEPKQLTAPGSLVKESSGHESVNQKPINEKSVGNKKIKTEAGELHGGVYSTPPATELSPDAEAYLKTVKAFPFRLVGEIQSLLANDKVMGTETISKNRSVNSRKELLTKGYLETFTVSGTGRSGKSQCDIIVTEKANMGSIYKPRGGYLHAFHCYRIKEFFSNNGAEVKIADTSTGQEIDLVVVSSDGKRIGIEVVVSGLVVENVRRYVSEGYFDRVLILVIDDKKKREVENMLSGVSNKVSIELLRDYFVSL